MSSSIFKASVRFLPFLFVSYFVLEEYLGEIPVPILAQDNSTYYLFYALFLLVLFSSIVFAISSYVTGKLKQTSIKWFRFLISAIEVGFFIFSILLFLYGVLQTSGQLLAYDYCGSTFNQGYRKALANGEMSFCLDESNFQDMEGASSFKGGGYCYTPTRKWMEFHIQTSGEESNLKYGLDRENLKASCVSAIARDLKNVSICELITEYKLPYVQGFNSALQPGDPFGCIDDYTEFIKNY